ncbi:hypothetical protein AG1IA_08324 [Rhizoctonia solani AG-1 IA]|uniref:Uncharacterized protein n=1 Tax=Thanatephorus cucumeris (strain AG1-IA) TaxID=983506 RepID=L8WLK3_THACA|nr:hypothetical protein AG1IA_08324 [Rhizoctonia solani AG-1 IA]
MDNSCSQPLQMSDTSIEDSEGTMSVLGSILEMCGQAFEVREMEPWSCARC